MFRRLPSTLFGLLLIFLMGACAPATTTDESAISDDTLEFATDSSADSLDQASTEPPPATLTIDGREQNAGITGYCWQLGDGTSICADPIGFTTPPDPIPAESTFLAQFEYMLDAKPGRVHLSIFPASQPVLMGPEESGWRYWKSVPGDQFTLPANNDPSIELTLEPGLYVFDMFVDWPDRGGVNYGFLVDVGGASGRDSTAFGDDQGLPDTDQGVLLEAITPDGRVVYLPVQPPSEESMMALLEGTLLEVDGCLRVEDGHYDDGWLVIWPFGSDISVADDGIEVIDERGKPVARVGEQLGAGGGAIENTRGMESINDMIPGMPIAGCRGPYWVAAPLQTMVE
jgi:hypothetical protein